MKKFFEQKFRNIARSLYGRLSKRVLGSRGNIRHCLPSLICSPEDCVTNKFLIELASNAAIIAQSNPIQIPVNDLSDNYFYNVFPGEHYRLLKAIASILKPTTMVEVGTYTGMGTVALAQGFSDGKLVTYDIVPWDHLKTHLTGANFQNERICQILGDLSDESVFNENLKILNSAQLIFVDAPKDSQFEYKFLPLLQKLKPMENRMLILDDIKFVNMIDLWRSIKSPKLDVTSFGHWSGTGIVDISDGLALAESY